MTNYDPYSGTVAVPPVEREWAAPGWVVIALLAGVSAGLAAVNLLMDGTLLPTLSMIVITGIVIVSFHRIDWGFNIFMGAVLLMDQFILEVGDTVTHDVYYFTNLKEYPYVKFPDGAVVNPMELHLLLLLLTWVLLLALKKDRGRAPVPSWTSFLGFIGAMGIAFVHGLATKGEFLWAIWEIRAISYFAVIFALTPQVIRNKQQVKNLFWVLIAAISVKAFQGIYRFAENGLGFGGVDLLTNSEDPVFMITLLLFLICLVLLGVKDGQRRALFFLLIPLLLGVYVGQRRSTYVSFLISVAALVFMLPPRPRKKLLGFGAVMAVLFTIYMAAYWDTYGRIGVIAQQVKSIIGTTDPTLSGVDYYSNLYREYENFNLATTIQGNPVAGVGFGIPYDTPLAWFDMLTKYPMLKYIPHNSWLWIFSKTGAIGFFFFITFVNLIVFRTAFAVNRLKDPYFRAVAMACALSVFNQISVAYVEMQLSFYRNMIYLACLMSLACIVPRLDREAEAPETAVVPS